MARYSLILESVAASRLGLTLTEIMRATGLASGTTHRLVNTLLDAGYITDDGGRKAYRIGPQLTRLFELARSPATEALLAQPVLQGLVSRFGETAFLAKLRGETVESVASAVPENYSQSHVQPGRIMPINAAASAKAIFAFQPEPVLARALAGPLQKFTHRTIVEPAKLRCHLDEVRAQGYAVCADELDLGVLSYACPIHLAGAGVLYSIGIVALSRRLMAFGASDVVAVLREAAHLTSTRLRSEIRIADAGGPAG
ncbi:MAG: IclR family transcriptional regulator [Rhodospirillales bacterium]|nr:IclR family transcriptional regulator [Rhodospirillales bacterium]